MISNAINHGLTLLFYRPTVACVFGGMVSPLGIATGFASKTVTYKVAMWVLSGNFGKNVFVQDLINPTFLSNYGFAIGFVITLITSYCAVVYIASKTLHWPLQLS